ncbi:MAG: hypothetical protein WC760_06375 [Bacteroidia bacterium]|jgi:hypothetical protein
MPTIYLKAETKSAIVTDLKKVFTKYAGETEYNQDGMAIHFIGDIEISSAVFNENRELVTDAVLIGAQHANIEMPEGFDASIFETAIPKPNNPIHKFLS